MHAFEEKPLPLLDGDEAAPAPLPQGQLPSYIRDHRKRLRGRLMSGGADAVPDYELLELVLFRAIPRQDVKPLSRRLLDTFGDFSGVISAPPTRLKQVKGVGDAAAIGDTSAAADVNDFGVLPLLRRHRLDDPLCLLQVFIGVPIAAQFHGIPHGT